MNRHASILLAGLLLGATIPAAAQRAVPLDEVLSGMTAEGNRLETLQVRLDRDTVNGLVDDHVVDSGELAFDARERRIRVTITDPATARQDVLVEAGVFRSFNPRTNQVTMGDLGSNDVAQFLVVGFGPGNASLESNFDVTLDGEERVDGVATSKIVLVPRSDQVRGNVLRIRLWIDQEHWIPVRQRLDQPGLNYQVVDYSDVRINSNLSDSDFELDLPDDAEVLRLN